MTIDNYLIQLQEEEIQEYIDPVSIGTAVGVSVAALQLVFRITASILIARHLVKTSKKSSTHSKQLASIVQDRQKWEVYILKWKIANAGVVAERPLVFVTSRLLKIMRPRETMAVLLHEAGHLKKKHITQQTVLGSLMRGMIAGTAVGVVAAGYQLPLFAFYLALLTSGIPLSRHHEYQADSWVVQYGYGQDLIEALKKLHKEYDRMTKSHSKAYRKLNELLSTHPTLEKRTINLLRDMETYKLILKASISELDVRNYVKQYFKDILPQE